MHYVNISGLKKNSSTRRPHGTGEDRESAIEDMAKIEAEPEE
jgi:hypothetical protein